MKPTIKYVSNPSKVPDRYKKYLYPVSVDAAYQQAIERLGLPPKKVLYHSHYPTFRKIVNELKKHGVNMATPQYGYMLAGQFWAVPGATMW
jgi:hypothetical protein